MGEVFAGRYELLDLIGEGGMGSVWRVWDAREGRVVAAKVLRQSDAVSLLRFVREQAMRVQHPHVLTPISWAGEDDRVLFTMPVVDGGSIATLVGDHGALPPRLVAELLRQLLDALDAVHSAGILHRDVKPANVLLTATGSDRPHAFLTDFGIAIEMDGPRFTQTGELTGTPGYLAPEVRLGAEPHPTADLYAVGLVGIAMLTGARPSLPAHRPPGVPDALWSLVTDLTAQDPDARPQDAAQALARLGSPELAWVEGGADDVEVLRQVAEPAAGRVQLTAQPAGGSRTPVLDPAPATRVAPGGLEAAPAAMATAPAAMEDAPTVLAGGAGRVGGDDEPTRVRPSERRPSGARRRRGWLAGALLLLAAVGGLVVWSPWSSSTGDLEVPDTPSSSTTPSSLPTSASTTAPATSSTSTRGTVQVGPLVTRVGQACEFSDVGVREETVAGEPVVCRLRDDGTYAWDPPVG